MPLYSFAILYTAPPLRGRELDVTHESLGGNPSKSEQSGGSRKGSTVGARELVRWTRRVITITLARHIKL